MPYLKKLSIMVSVAVVAVIMVYLCPVTAAKVTRCKYTLRKDVRYPLTIALLTDSRNDFRRQKNVQENLMYSGDLAECFYLPQYISLSVNESLHLEKEGWTMVQSGIEQALVSTGVMYGEMPNVVIGPFYTNMAMVLERMEIPYIITDHKGFNWIDMSRVTDRVAWKTVVEIPPPAQKQNLAVVDLFKSRVWPSAIMIMPMSAADNQECQNLVGQLLNSSVSLIPFTLDVQSLDLVDDIRDIIRSARLVRQNQIVVCSPRDVRDGLIEMILLQARNLGILNNKEVAFVFVDPSSSLVPFSGVKAMHSLGLLSAQCQILAFRYALPRQDDSSNEEGRAVSSDAGRVVTLALHRYLQNQDRPSDKFSHNRFMEALKTVKLEGLTGNIEFDEKGQRKNYALELYNHGGNNLYTKIAEWRPNFPTARERLNITNEDDEEAQIRRLGIFPDLVTIVVVEEFPFVMKRVNGPPEFEGFTIDLLNELARLLNFKFEIYVSPQNKYGGINSDGSWDGMVGEVVSGNATLACGAISITSARESVIDFSLGVISTGINILIHKPDESYNMFQFMKPFSLQLWVAILGALALVSAVNFVLDYWSGKQRKFTFKETIWFTIGTMLKRGSDFVPIPVGQRTIILGFSFFVIITVSSYTANMAAFLTTKKYAKTVDSFESLAESNSIQVTSVKHSATATFFEKGTKPVYWRLWRKMKRAGLVNETKYGIQRVENNAHAAFVFDYLINEGAQNRICSTMAIGSPILLQEHGIGMKVGAPFRTSINIAILKLKESGFLSRLKKKWWDDKRKCQLGTQLTADEAQFGIQHTLGVFIVSLFGLCVSATLFLSKKISFSISTRWKEYRSRHDNKNGICNEAGTPV